MGVKTNLAAAIATVVGAAAQTPTAIQPPANATLVARYRAVGVQIYTCTAGKNGTGWVLKAPDAELYDPGNAPVIHHSAGPTWTARDGATVIGKLLAKAPSPNPGAIAWLLLDATSSGRGLLAGTRYVVRRDTKGGLAPVGPCAAETTARVPYTATYEFYR